MNKIEQLTLNAVAHISASKSLDGISPTHALSIEIINMMKEYPAEEVKQTLNKLIKQRILIYGRTVNDVYFKVRTNEL